MHCSIAVVRSPRMVATCTRSRATETRRASLWDPCRWAEWESSARYAGSAPSRHIFFYNTLVHRVRMHCELRLRSAFGTLLWGSNLDLLARVWILGIGSVFPPPFRLVHDPNIELSPWLQFRWASDSLVSPPTSSPLAYTRSCHLHRTVPGDFIGIFQTTISKAKQKRW